MMSLHTMTRSEMAALKMIEQREARENKRIAPLLHEAIALADEWNNVGSLAWLYTNDEATGRKIIASARAAGFRHVQLFRTPFDTPKPDFTGTVETDPIELNGPNNLALKFRNLLTHNLQMSPPVACNWTGNGQFLLTIDEPNDAVWLEILASHKILELHRVRMNDMVNSHYRVTMHKDAALNFKTNPPKR